MPTPFAAYWVNFIALLLQMFGVLSNPVVSLMWFLEQVDVHVLGATTRSSDLRIVLSFCINSAIVIGMYFHSYNNN